MRSSITAAIRRDLHVVVEGAVKLIRDDVEGREMLLWVLERCGVLGQSALEDVMLLDVPSRIAKYLLDSGTGLPEPHALTLTQDELAAAVGSTRVTVNRSSPISSTAG